MATIVKMPKTGLNMTEGDVTRFLVKEGDAVLEDQPLVEIETDKNTTEIVSPEAGVVLKLLCEEGDTLPILSPVLVIGQPGESYRIDKVESEAPVQVSTPIFAEPQVSHVPAQQIAGGASARIMATPLAKRLAKEMGIDLKQVLGTGPDGAIMRRDILTYRVKQAEQPEKSEASKTAAAPTVQQFPALWDLPVLQRIPLTGMRRAIAQNMSMSKSLIPHFTLTVTVDMSEAIALREQVLKLTGKKVSYNDILTKAVCRVLRINPMINSAVSNDEILQYSTINVGIAVGLDNGLIVPVIHGAGDMSLAQIAETSTKLIRDAREGTLSAESCTGGTITISNLGMYGIESFSAIINMPESCILAVGRIAETPVVKNGEVVIRPMMSLTASFDHRIIDGVVGSKFLADLKRSIENPMLLL